MEELQSVTESPIRMATIKIQQVLARIWRNRNCAVSRNVKWCSCCGKLPKNLKIEVPCDPPNLFFGRKPEEFLDESGRDICIAMFPAALFAVTKTWKQG